MMCSNGKDVFIVHDDGSWGILTELDPPLSSKQIKELALEHPATDEMNVYADRVRLDVKTI